MERMLKWRTTWMELYMIFNCLLYGTQIILYILIFWPGTSHSKKMACTYLYVVMMGTNFISVALAYMRYLYLGDRFALSLVSVFFHSLSMRNLWQDFLFQSA